MTFDHIKLGDLRIRAERAEAQRDRLGELGDDMAAVLNGKGGRYAEALADEWETARAWDGMPQRPQGQIGAPMSRRKGAKP